MLGFPWALRIGIRNQRKKFKGCRLQLSRNICRLQFSCNTHTCFVMVGTRSPPLKDKGSRWSFLINLDGCQNYGSFLGTLNIRCRIIIGIQKGTIILTTTHIAYNPLTHYSSFPIIPHITPSFPHKFWQNRFHFPRCRMLSRSRRCLISFIAPLGCEVLFLQLRARV